MELCTCFHHILLRLRKEKRAEDVYLVCDLMLTSSGAERLKMVERISERWYLSQGFNGKDIEQYATSKKEATHYSVAEC